MNKAIVEKRLSSATEERELSHNVFLVAPGVYRMKDLFVNVFIIQDAEATGWVLIDAGLKSSAPKIKLMVEELFGSKGSTPKAIVMTHAHFDHRGSLQQLVEEWNVPVYCHHMELPYLTGKSSYPPPDPSVGGGMMATLSFIYPKSPIDIKEHLLVLPEDGNIPGLEEWKWIHTPGHTPGHISLFREKDGVLVAGDAFVTTMQESIISVATQAKLISGPPKYFTPDWGAAARSVKELASLEPNVIVTGHGQAFYGDEARKDLHKLARDFWKLGIPATGRYVKEAAEFNENGMPTHIPAPKGIMLKRLAIAAGLMALGYIIYQQRRHTKGMNKTLSKQLGKALMLSSYGAIGAVAPASPAVPDIPLIPAF